MSYIRGRVQDSFIAEAKKIRALRDKQYPNLYREVDTDERWVGEVGELCFNGWARRNTSLPVVWIKDNAAGAADFLIGGTPVGLKTVKRKVRPNDRYTAQISAKHITEPVDFYFFACYMHKVQEMYLLGAITRTDFLRQARYYGAGEQVHENYTIREGHEIYNIEIGKLTPPLPWLKSLSPAAPMN
ncbi:hypothetical protein AB0H71_25430 [Nocardia sp. NPDC050697]|uniref:hypothetical protein n=1 Tax=Nocardia sp. NPDC050697 TaxID=3155158 RepID=UPI0033EFE8BD